MASDDLGLAHPSAQAAEGDVRAALEQVLAYLEGQNTKTKSNGVFNAHARRTICGLLALSAEAAGTIAAARKQAAEEMRERAAEDGWHVGQPVEKVTGDYRIKGEVRGFFHLHVGGPLRLVVAHQAEGGGRFCHIYSPANLRALPPSSSPEDQQKAAATPTIADPGGEARS